MWGRIATLAALLACGGCANTGPTAAQTEYGNYVAADTAARAASQPCYTALAQTPEWAVIAPRLSVGSNPDGTVPASALASNIRPTDDEARALIGLHGKMLKCRQILLNGLAQAHPAILKSQQAREAAYDSLMTQIVRRQIGWAQFVQGNRQLNKAVAEQQASYYKQINAQYAQGHAAELQQRAQMATDDQAASDALGRALGGAAQEYQKSRQPMPMVFTNCQRTGTMINCTSF